MRFRTLTDDDIFISYAHLDGGTYAAGLADELQKRGFSCFIDRLGTEPGRNLPLSLRRKIRRCAMLVVIGTERAGTRKTIEDEIKEFMKNGRRTAVVPVDFNGSVYHACWYPLIEGIALEAEKSSTALESGNPSPSVVSRIEKQFSYARHKQRLHRATLGTAALLVLVILAAISAGAYARNQLAVATQASNIAAQERAQAVASAQARDQAIAERRLAEIEKKAAIQVRDKALADAAKAGNEARLSRIEEARQARAARTAMATTAVAVADAQQQKLATDTATLESHMAKAEADRQKAIAESRLWANQSEQLLRQHPKELSSSLSRAVNALKRSSTIEADTALRRSLALMPRLQSRERYAGSLLDTALSPNGQYLATLTSDKVFHVYKSGSQTPISEAPCSCEGVALAKNLYRIAVSSDGRQGAVVHGHESFVFDLQTGKRQSVELGTGSRIFKKLALSPDGKYLAVAYQSSGISYDSGALLFEVASGRVVKSFDQETDNIWIRDVVFGPMGDLAIGGLELVPKAPFYAIRTTPRGLRIPLILGDDTDSHPIVRKRDLELLHPTRDECSFGPCRTN